MSSHDETPTDHGPDEADTASFQQFMDDHGDAGVDDGRTFRLLSLLAGVLALVVVMYLLLF
jgi:hypothetical protein